MILNVKASREGFRKVNFKPGLNLILAERTIESSSKDSRNGVGKTTLLEIIHFCLGSSPTSDSILIKKQLEDWTFTLELLILGRKISVHRNTASRKLVEIEGDFSGWPIQPSFDKEKRRSVLKIRDWNCVLGNLWFGLPLTLDDVSYAPTFRSLISYFIRKNRDAFSTPFEHFRKQVEWDKQVNNSYLIGLDWNFASRAQTLKDKGKVLVDLNRASKSGLIDQFVGSIGEYEAQRVRLEQKVNQEKEQLLNFKVHPQYRDVEEKANELTQKIHLLSNENIKENQLLVYFQKSVESEKPADDQVILEIYNEANILLPGTVVRRFNDVREFHEKLVRNRREFLAVEISKIKSNITNRSIEIEKYANERAELLSILKTHGALDEHSKLQTRHQELVGELDGVKNKISTLKQLENNKSVIKTEKEELLRVGRRDYEERSKIRESAISIFNSYSEELYEAPGKLIIDLGPNGFTFNVEIERSGSQGIDQMKVFCYDLMLAQLWSKKPNSPKFLFHDSTIFDGVDERQIARAIELAAKISAEHGFQYICSINSDNLPRNEFSKNFDPYSFVTLTLTDSTEDGSLLGVRF